jgi:hypothetical protein
VAEGLDLQVELTVDASTGWARARVEVARIVERERRAEPGALASS